MLSAAQVRERALALKRADPETILLWAVDAFPGKTALTVSFGGGGVVLAHLLSRIDRTVPVLFLDTGFHFAETYAFKERFAKRYGLNLVELKPLTDPGPLYKTDPDRCCFIRKVDGARRAARGRRPPDCEGVSVGELESSGRMALHPGKRRAASPAARPGLLEHRLLAVHPPHRPRRGRAGGAVERQRQDRVRPAHLHRQAGGAKL